MSPAIRLIIAAAAALVLLPAIVLVLWHMPGFGDHSLPYGDEINHAAAAERHVTNMVTAVNFDYRGLDTIGEEYMLLAAVTGTVVLLRGRRGENVTDAPATVQGRSIRSPSEGVVLICRLFAPILLLFGIYMAAHAQLTPGGGFQGGAMIGSGMALLYLGEGYATWGRVMLSHVFDPIEAVGALIFILAGFGPMVVGAHFLENILPLGQTRALLSGGLILIENFGVALAVTAGFVLLLVEFLEETRVSQGEDS
ncbi:sodium:proton antiporter [Bradyrhizobium sp. ISRA443]|uniref:MnhB domain-containing protein n=1 Tax=unclassified Bradyrhizobium TaxID=2631580 RepID=UPI002479FC67|nr:MULTISPECIES: MnhB domain-containing protein [unclassified Bradyrhizobium]WGR93115.1 sodium:proton antiporter [Bradyrhizobium sp. ISRA435]WGR97624.1 sodium:proton antiporter [Bradyrhizobium sp. ISRA436]WGS04514.1 sodium:proton antiporter [Bradyrhizobium sp. ISRA437]WGS11395.1 sodium:proton antiporter [Bradyrhizobium sp. ISRA443]